MFFITADNLIPWLKPQMFEGDSGVPSGAATTPSNEPPAASTTTEPGIPAPNNDDPRKSMSLAEFFSKGSQASTQEPTNTPPTNEPVPGTNEPGGTPNAEPPAVNEPQNINIPDKFKNPDGSVNIEALAKSYTNMEQMYSKSQNAQQFESLQQSNQQLTQEITKLVGALNANNEPKPPQLTPEEIEAQKEADNEAFFEEYNKDPMGAIAKIVKQSVESSVKPMLEPVLDQYSQNQQLEDFNSQLDTVYQAHPEDFEQMLPAIRDVLNELGDDFLGAVKNPVEIAYNLAKSRQVNTGSPTPASTVPNPDELLNNQDFISKLAQNPTVKNMVLQQHMQDIKNNPAPPVIGTLPGGLPPSTQPVDLKNPKTAKEALKAKYAGFSLIG